MTGRRDAGSTSLTTVLLTPVFVVIAFAAFQAAIWGHTRTEARAVARDAASWVARSGRPPDAVREAAVATLRADSHLADPVVEIDARADLVVVTVRGRAPGIVRGTSSDVTVVEALPREPLP